MPSGSTTRPLSVLICKNPLPVRPPAARILVIRLGAVGDVVRSLPAVSALRTGYPEAHITWLVEPASAALLAGQPWLDAVLLFPRDRLRAALRVGHLFRLGRELVSFARDLRARRFDLVVDFHAILKSGLLSYASGAARRVTFAPPFGREGAWWFANERAELSQRHISRFLRNEALVRFLGCEDVGEVSPLHLDPVSVERMIAALGPGPRPLAVHPGTSVGTPHKRWPAWAYADVIRSLHRERGIEAVVTAGPDASERASAAEVVRLADGAARLAPPTPTLRDLAALFSRCRLYLGGDTGPMHLASLVGTPVLQILGPTDPVENAPWVATPSRTVRAGVACSPCRRGCAAATCMMAVAPGAVLAGLRELLDLPGGDAMAAASPRPWRGPR